MKKFKEFHIRTKPFIADMLSGILWEINIAGVTEEDNFIKVFVEGDAVSEKDIENLLIKLKEEKLINDFSVEQYEVENKNWNEEWEKNLNIIKVTDKIVIKPSTKDYNPEEGEIILTIDPKMSFGTGEHQTTKLMLKMIEKYVKPKDKVLDVGSGTSVLAIATIKLGAEKAVAIDNDELCYDNGKENTLLNNVKEKVEVRIGEIKDIKETDFDLIIANIQKNILIEIAHEIKNKTKSKGTIILSGLLKEDEDDIVECYTQPDFVLEEKQTMDEWIALVFKKKV